VEHVVHEDIQIDFHAIPGKKCYVDEDNIPDGTSTALKLSEAYSEQSVFL
jgi:hypothetical protein